MMQFNKIFFHSLNSKTELCELGLKYGTDKTPFLDHDAYNLGNIITSHGYTPFYNFLFSPLKYKDITFGEIGIYKNSSMKMWREYFTNAKLYGWDCKPDQNVEERYKVDFIESAKRDGLHNTIYDYINVKDERSILHSLKKTQTKFDVLIDDSDHDVWSQIRIIRSAPSFLKTGGMLIIEDMYHSVDQFFEEIKLYEHHRFYDSITCVETDHYNKVYGDGIILLVRNGVNV